MERLTFAATGKVEGRTLSGVAHMYGTVTVDGRKHSFAPGAFDKAIAAGGVVSFAYHDETKPLAAMRVGTLRLTAGAEEMGYSLDLPEGVSYADDMRALVANRQIDLGMSFAIAAGGKYVKQDGVKTWTEVNLLSVDPVAMPAFEGTSVVLNSATEPVETSHSTSIKIRARVAANASKQRPSSTERRLLLHSK
jgi:HK97 family phage prohead protease